MNAEFEAPVGWKLAMIIWHQRSVGFVTKLSLLAVLVLCSSCISYPNYVWLNRLFCLRVGLGDIVGAAP